MHYNWKLISQQQPDDKSFDKVLYWDSVTKETVVDDVNAWTDWRNDYKYWQPLPTQPE